MKTIAVINQKGGVGKSSAAQSLGAGLSLNGKKVLQIDLDSQANLTYLMTGSEKGYNALGVLERPETIKSEIQHTPQGDLIASSPLLSRADSIITETGKEYRLKEALVLISKDYDYCIIDTPPALSILTINALTAANSVVIPVQADIMSLQGVGQLSQTIEAVKHYCNNSLKVEGLLLTRYSSRSLLSRDMADYLYETAKQLNTKLFKAKIREAIAIKEAQANRTDIFTYSPKSKIAEDYRSFIDELLKEDE